MKIGDFAERAGVNVQTVRYYERRELLREPDRTDSGYRSYEEQDLLRLRFILRAKELGFTLSEVAELLDLRVDPDRSAADVRVRALEKIRKTDSKIEDLQQIRAALQRVVSACDAHGSPEECALMHAIGADEDF